MITRRSLMGSGALAALASLASAGRAKLFFDRSSHPIGINLYVVADLIAKDPVSTINALRQIGYREVETGLEGHDAAMLGKAIKEAGLRCSSFNLLPRAMRGGRSLADEAGVVADDARALGAAYITCTLYPLPGVIEMRRNPGEGTKALLERVAGSAGKDEWRRAADFLNEKATALRKEGVAFAYHNHNPELRPLGETNGLSILLENTDPALVSFHMDAGWVVAGGQDPVTILRAYPDRFRLMHVKDLAPASDVNTQLEALTTEVGYGVIDWARVLPIARAAGIRHFTVEQEPPYTAHPPLEAAKRSFEWLNRLDVVAAHSR